MKCLHFVLFHILKLQKFLIFKLYADYGFRCQESTLFLYSKSAVHVQHFYNSKCQQGLKTKSTSRDRKQKVLVDASSKSGQCRILFKTCSCLLGNIGTPGGKGPKGSKGEKCFIINTGFSKKRVTTISAYVIGDHGHNGKTVMVSNCIKI